MPRLNAALRLLVVRMKAGRRPLSSSPGRGFSGWCELAGLSLFVVGTAALLVLAVAPLASGWRVVVVEGASMEPDIPLGGIEFVSPAPSGLRPGDIILYRNPDLPGRIVTHRIVAVSDDGQFVTTKGDANRDQDAPVAVGDVVGRYEGSVPFVGYAIAWLRSGLGRKVAILLPGLSLCAFESVNLVGAVRSPRRRKPDVLAPASQRTQKLHPPARRPGAAPSSCLLHRSGDTPRLAVRTTHQRPGRIHPGHVDRMGRYF